MQFFLGNEGIAMFLTLLLLALTLGVLLVMWRPANTEPWRIVVTVAFVLLWILYLVPIGQVHR